MTRYEFLKELANNNLNVSETARKMHYHRNSIVYHLEKIKEETGLNPVKFYDMIKLLHMFKEDD